jgi:hypothetical protein
MRLRLTLLALVAAAIAVPAAGAEGPPPPPKERPAPATFPPDAAARIAVEVCARVQVENCVEQATQLAQAALERCRNAPAPAMCVKEAVIRGLRGEAAGAGDTPAEDDTPAEEEDSEDLASTMCARAKARFPVRFAQHFDSLDACVSALNEALEVCPTEAAARGCLEAALRKALAGTDEKRAKTEVLARTLERTLCRLAEQHGRRCGPAVRARARAIAARCATAADPRACVREALKPKAGRKP